MKEGTKIKNGSTIYTVKEWNENSALCILEQINKTDRRNKVVKKEWVINGLDSKRMKIID